MNQEFYASLSCFFQCQGIEKKNFTCKEAANTIFLEDYRSGWTLLKHEKILGK